MIKSFKNQGTEDIFNGINSKAARKLIDTNLMGVALRRLGQLASAASLSDLAIIRALRLHELENDRKGQHSIRINDTYRVCFVWNGKDAEDVEVIDYH